MITATLPDVDLEAWLAGEIEEPCETKIGPRPCGEVADWLIRIRSACGHGRSHGFLCDFHKRFFGPHDLHCIRCRAPVEIIVVERIRCPR